eukprot:scaffold69808_cov57-Phaeocystis_antarctica.AAC.2
MRRLSAPPLAPTPHASLSPGAVNSTSTLPSPRRSPRRRVARRRWTSPTLDSTRPSCTLELWTSSTGWRSSSSWRTPPLSQGRSAQHQSPCAGHALSLSSEGRFATVRPRLVAGLLHQKGCVKTVVTSGRLSPPADNTPEPAAGLRLQELSTDCKHACLLRIGL